MTEENLTKSTEQTENQEENQPTPTRCITGALICGGLGFAMSNLLIQFQITFETKPVPPINRREVIISSPAGP